MKLDQLEFIQPSMALLCRLEWFQILEHVHFKPFRALGALPRGLAPPLCGTSAGRMTFT